MADANPQIRKLFDLVEADLAGGWAGNTDAQVKTWLDANVTQQSNVGWTDLMRWLARHNGIVRLETSKEDTGAATAVRSASAYLLATVQAGMDLDLSDSEVRTFLGNLVPAVFNATERNDLLSISDTQVPRHILEGVPSGLGAIQRARP